MSTLTPEAQNLFYTGKQLKFTLPSGKRLTIRETNGDDEGILSQLSNIKEGMDVALATFLASVIISVEGMRDKPTAEQIREWHLRDIQYLAFKVRVHSLGSEMKYSTHCQNEKCGKPIPELEEDLNQFDDDLSNPTKEPTQYQIRPYPMGDAIEVSMKTSSGKQLRFKILRGVSTKKTLETPEDQSNRNTDYVVRELEIFNNNEWTKVIRFSIFSSKEMAEIRKKVKEVDGIFDPVSEFNCPHCNVHQGVPVMSIGDFFYPVEI